MARAIAPTPVLKGKDAERVLSQLCKNDSSPKDRKESQRLRDVYEKFKTKGIEL
jgi:hypothetical protein